MSPIIADPAIRPLRDPSPCCAAVPPGAPPGMAARVERALIRHPRIRSTLHLAMIVLYLTLILVPPFLGRPAEHATPFTSFVRFSQFVFWYLWWPFVVLSMILFGRAWCGFLCPEGALAAWASRFGGDRPIPRWMRFGGIPLLAFVGITIYGQLTGVYEYAAPQLLILGGSTALAMSFALVYTKRGWVWCRYLCPVSLLFGVFSRLGALHFRVDQTRLAAWRPTPGETGKKDPCPVFIYLPKMATNRYCLMCFRCAGWRDSIHLELRCPGEELHHINNAEPLFWEVVFLFGAIGLPLGVFHWTVDPLFQRLKQLIGGVALGLGLGNVIGASAPWWMLSNHPEAGEVFNVLDGATIVSFLLGATLLAIAVFSGLTWLSARILAPALLEPARMRELFTRIGYLYTPLSLFSLFLGLSELTFAYLKTVGFPPIATDLIRGALLLGGAWWSGHLARAIIRQQTADTRRAALALVPHLAGAVLIMAAWVPVFYVW
jgi:polyferredoxin